MMATGIGHVGEWAAGIGRVVEDQPGIWVFEHDGVRLIALADAAEDRMRVMALVTDEPLGEPELRAVMEANFDRAREAKYAMSHGRLWALFMHPLSELSHTLFDAAVKQVTNLVRNYGTTYDGAGVRITRGGRIKP